LPCCVPYVLLRHRCGTVSPMAIDVSEDQAARELSAERLMLFSDAVLAIALTLLALELPVPDGDDNAGVLHSAYEHRDEYLAFLVSFLVIAAHWAGHHRAFRHVTGLGGRISSLNMYWLFTQVVTPFATKVLTGDGGFEVRFAFYAVVQSVGFLLFLAMLRQMDKYHLYGPGRTEHGTRRSKRRTAVFAVAFVVSIPVALLWGKWAYVCWIVVPLAGNLLLRVRAGKDS
jgi:uncharacterized membrane protein